MYSNFVLFFMMLLIFSKKKELFKAWIKYVVLNQER